MSTKRLLYWETDNTSNPGFLPSLKSARDLVFPWNNRNVREILRNLIGSLENWELDKTDFPWKIKTLDCIIFYTTGGLSDVSDVEEMKSSDDANQPSPEYVHKLKLKLKKCTSKIRDRNKIIKNQNEDIDNFLEDITSKESKISQLQDVIEQLKRHSGGAVKTPKKESRLDDINTPSFASIESHSSSSSFTLSGSNDTLVKELFDLVEECCLEIQSLQELVKDSPSITDMHELREKLRVSQAKVNLLSIFFS